MARFLIRFRSAAAIVSRLPAAGTSAAGVFWVWPGDQRLLPSKAPFAWRVRMLPEPTSTPSDASIVRRSILSLRVLMSGPTGQRLRDGRAMKNHNL